MRSARIAYRPPEITAFHRRFVVTHDRDPSRAVDLPAADRDHARRFASVWLGVEPDRLTVVERLPGKEIA